MYNPSPVYQTAETAFSEHVDPHAIIIWLSTDWLSSTLLPRTGHHLLGTFDELQRTELEGITNCSLNET